MSVKKLVFENSIPGGSAIVVKRPFILPERGIRIEFEGLVVEMTADEWQNIGNLFLGPVE